MAKEPTDNMEELAEDDAPETGRSGNLFVLSGIVKILVYIVGALLGVIAMVTIAIVTYKFMDNRSKNQSASSIESQFTSTNKIYSYYDQIPQIRTQTADPFKSSSSVTVSIQLGYDAVDSPHLTEELARRNPQLTDMFRSYFAQHTAEELNSGNEERVKIELRNMINELLQNGQIEEVVFPEYQVLTR